MPCYLCNDLKFIAPYQSATVPGRPIFIAHEPRPAGHDHPVLPCPACNTGRRPEVDDFADDMEARLRANDYKGGWQGMSLYDLLELMKKEVVELEEAIATGTPAWKVIWEAADAANFLLMVADQRAHGRGLDYCSKCRVVHTRYGEEFANCNHSCHEPRRLIRVHEVNFTINRRDEESHVEKAARDVRNDG